LLKEGENGATLYFVDENKKLQSIHKSANSFADHPDLKLIDTTGAGDCFTGAFAVKVAEGVPYDKAIEFAN